MTEKIVEKITGKNDSRGRKTHRRKRAASPGKTAGRFASATIDPDEHLWRSLSGGHSGISRIKHDRMQRLAYELWLTNLMGQRLIEVVTDHVVGEGITWRSDDPAAEAAARAFWRDPVNQMDLRFERLVSELGIFGELLLPIAVSEYEGRVRLGYVSPRLIEEVVPDPDNCALPIGVVIRSEEKGFVSSRKTRRVKTVLGGDPREYLGAAAQKKERASATARRSSFRSTRRATPRGGHPTSSPPSTGSTSTSGSSSTPPSARAFRTASSSRGR